ncbi:MAG TPA: hypothetical protein DCE44_11605 [Verrucomicrobiales bacterium]|nr:hypothetical protein [Verrucomicrobiales bacterium]
MKKQPPARASVPPAPAPSPAERTSGEITFVSRRHLRFGWLALLVFLVLGAVLEALHAFKVPAYLNVTNSTRRLMWSLAHAHGTLLALVNLAFAASLSLMPDWKAHWRDIASVGLIGASLLLPTGFFLGGMTVHGGDPGVGILLVPLGAALLFGSVLLAGLAANSASTGGSQKGSVRKQKDLPQ